jgi:hypothetical protein
MKVAVKARFEAHKLEGTRMKTVASPKKDQQGTLLGGFDYKEIEVDAGWMVYLPNGSSLHIWTEEEMNRQGFLRPPAHVDMETGDVVGNPEAESLKNKSEQKERATKSSKVHHTI